MRWFECTLHMGEAKSATFTTRTFVGSGINATPCGIVLETEPDKKHREQGIHNDEPALSTAVLPLLTTSASLLP